MPHLLPTPLVLGDNNIWPFRLAEGGWVLVDAGLDYVDGGMSSWDALTAQARGIGCAVEDVRAVVITHEHIDHAGLAARWAEQGVAIVAMPEALPMLAAGRAAQDAIRARRFEELRLHGCPADVLVAIEAAQRARDTHVLGWAPCPEDTLVPAQDGNTFALEDGRTLHVIAAPGHTPGNLVAFVADGEGASTGDLCSGDTLLPTTIPTPGLQFPAYAEALARGATVEDAHDAPRWPSLPPFLRSVDRLRALDVRRILPGHGAIVDEPQRLFAQFTEHHARRSQRAIAHLERSGASTAYEVVRGIFPRLPNERIGQAMTEMIGHLDVLVDRGDAVQARDEDGVTRTHLAR